MAKVGRPKGKHKTHTVTFTISKEHYAMYRQYKDSGGKAVVLLEKALEDVQGKRGG